MRRRAQPGNPNVMLKSRSIRMLLAGASVATLTCAVAPSAGAAPLLLGPGGGHTGNITVGPAQTYDFVIINDYDLTGSFINQGIIGGFTAPVGLTVTNGAIITGVLSNAATGKIFASEQGIVVENSTVPSIVNAGVITVTNNSGADATGVVINDHSAGNIASTFTNNGTLTVTSSDHAVSTTDAIAEAHAVGAIQDGGSGGTVTDELVNNGTLTVNATAVAQANDALAIAEGTGENQSGHAAGAVSLTAVNNGTLNVNVSATALGGNAGEAGALGVGYGFIQDGGSGATVADSVTNSGMVNVLVSENANAYIADAEGYANAFEQTAGSADGSTASVANAGTFLVSNLATITAAHSGDAVISADGGQQTVSSGGDASASIDNSGTFTVESVATVLGLHSADAYANAGGVQQTVSADGDGSAVVSNEGTFGVTATANANSPGSSSPTPT